MSRPPNPLVLKVREGGVSTSTIFRYPVHKRLPNIEILHGRTHSSCYSNNVGKGYWSADRKCGGSHALLECSLLHALRFEFGG